MEVMGKIMAPGIVKQPSTGGALTGRKYSPYLNEILTQMITQRYFENFNSLVNALYR